MLGSQVRAKRVLPSANARVEAGEEGKQFSPPMNADERQ